MKKVFIYGDRKTLFNYVNTLKKINVKAVVSTDVFDCKQCSFLLLAGGGDISPCLYNSINYNNCFDIDLERDIAEQFLIKYFLKKNLPIFGICRGLQVINVFFGGTLNTVINQKDVHYKKNKDCFHSTINYGFMKNLYGKVATVNSCHRQSASIIGKGLKVSAVSPDNVVEAIENNFLNIYAVQFHPERMGESGITLLDKWFNNHL